MDDEDEDEVAPIYSDGEDSEEDGEQPQLDPVTGLMAGQQVNQPPIVPQPSAGLTQTLPIIQQVGALVSSQKMERFLAISVILKILFVRVQILDN